MKPAKGEGSGDFGSLKDFRSLSKPRNKRRYMMAMVLGTALSAFGSGTAQAAPAEVSAGAIRDVSRYCTACWRNARLPADRWDDCTQQVLCRLLERVSPDDWDRLLSDDGETRREFIRAIDAVKKRTQRDARRTSALVGVVTDRRHTGLQIRGDDRDAVRHAARELLTDRQKRILQMSFEGWSVHDMAGAMDLAPERVSDEKYKAVQKLKEHFAEPAARDA